MSAVLKGAEMAPFFLELPVNNSREAIMANVRECVSRGLPELRQQPWKDRPLLVVGGGPSLNDYLPILKALQPECDILAVNGAYKYLVSLGIVPNYFVLIDSRPDNAVHVEDPQDGTLHILASQVHPKVFDALLGYNVGVVHLQTATTVEALNDPARTRYLQAPIGMASVHAIYIGLGLGYRDQRLFGYDFSRAGTSYAFPQPLNDNDDEIEIPLNGKVYRTTVALARTAEQFVQAIHPMIAKRGLSVTLYCEGLLPAMVEADNQPATEASERTKYEAIWKHDSYRKVSPGLEGVHQALARLDPDPGSSICDFGCGTGRTVLYLMKNGFDAFGVDITETAVESPIPFIEAALWDGSKLPKVEYGLCTDVLEHIPTERVRETLQAMHDACSVAVYLDIDTIPDSFGVLIGRRLHMTVMSAESWKELLGQFWPVVEDYTTGERQAVFVCRR
jgi:hypothetical protein